MHLGRSIFVLTLAGTACFATGVFAQGRKGMNMPKPKAVNPGRAPKPPKMAREHAAPLEQFERMPPEERQKALSRLPADKREKVERQLQRYDQLTPAQREQLEWFNHLPPERQSSFRQAFARFQRQPPERQQVMREELNRLRAMPDEERQARLASPEFRSRYRNNEQQILTEMSGVFPE